MSYVMRKPVHIIYVQQKHRPACAFAQSDQRLCYSLVFVVAIPKKASKAKQPADLSTSPKTSFLVMRLIYKTFYLSSYSHVGWDSPFVHSCVGTRHRTNICKSLMEMIVLTLLSATELPAAKQGMPSILRPSQGFWGIGEQWQLFQGKKGIKV